MVDTGCCVLVCGSGYVILDRSFVFVHLDSVRIIFSVKYIHFIVAKKTK